jgi:hypothetical protein
MKQFAFFAIFVCVLMFCPQRGHAQNEVFTVFQCVPSSCVDSVGPAFNGIATLVVHAACTTGVTYDVGATTTISNCSLPYTAENDAQALQTQLLDDCGVPFFLDTLQLNESITNIFGIVVFHQSQEESCDGGTGAPTVFGSVPC